MSVSPGKSRVDGWEMRKKNGTTEVPRHRENKMNEGEVELSGICGITGLFRGKTTREFEKNGVKKVKSRTWVDVTKTLNRKRQAVAGRPAVHPRRVGFAASGLAWFV